MTTFVLVHGSWHGEWCWQDVVPLLKKHHHEVIALDLPGHGADHTPLLNVTLKSYTDSIKLILDACSEPVILVGHSMAGMVISQAAEYWPEKIKQLIYVAAFIPQHNECLSDIVRRQPTSDISANIHGVGAEGALYFPFEKMYEFGYQCCSLEKFQAIQDKFCVEPLRPYFDKVTLTPERFGQIPRYYVACEKDHAIWYASQQRMLQATPCETVVLPTDHSPFFSQPQALSDALHRFSFRSLK